MDGGMNREDIIRMAREAGWSGLYTTYNEPTGKADWQMVKESLTVPVTMEQITRFAALVAAAEREACEQACEEVARKYQQQHYASAENIADECAAAIRARGQT